MTFYDSVISNLKGIVASKKDGVPLNYLDNEYRFLTGEYFPLKKLGYNTILDFIKEHQQLFFLQGTGRYIRVFNIVTKIENDSTLNLISLIQNTQPKNRYNNPQPGNYNNNQTSNGSFKLNYRPVSILSYDDVVRNNYNFSTYQHPNIGYTPSKCITMKTTNYSLVPVRCILNAKRPKSEINAGEANCEANLEVTVKSEVTTQTFDNRSKTNNVTYFTFHSLELIGVIIDIILETKFVILNKVLDLTIDGELYHDFRLLTGLNVEPVLFNDYVINSIESQNCQKLYKGLISLNNTKTKCIFNINPIDHCIASLPYFEFDCSNEYNINIVKRFHNGLVAFKILNKSHPDLPWKKVLISESDKTIIESQHFWSWMPGSLCLVQMPFSQVKRHRILPVERALIMLSEVVTLEHRSQQCSKRSLIRKTSFYLLDHDLEVEGLLSCASSFQDVKQNSKKPNMTDIVFVCNMSLMPRNTPCKIQFASIRNFKDISDHFINDTETLKPNRKIVLKNIKMRNYVFHFQFVYSCKAIVNCDAEESRAVIDYKDIDIYQNDTTKNDTKDYCKNIEIHHEHPLTNGVDEDTIDVCRKDVIDKDVIVDNGNEVTITQQEIAILVNDIIKCHNENSHMNNDIPKNNHQEDGLNSTEIIDSISATNDSPEVKNEIIVITDSDNVCTTNTLDKSVSCEIIDSQYSKTHISNHFPSDLNKFSDSTRNKGEVSNSSHQFNGISGTLNGPKKSMCDKISVVSSSENEDDSESVDSLKVSSYLPVCSIGKRDNVSLPNSIISYLENNAYPPRKCLKPLTTDAVNVFHGRIVKILHIQMGSAVIMLFDSIKLIRREIKMEILKRQVLSKVEKVLVGDFFIWRQIQKECNSDEWSLVEVIQIVSEMSVLVNKVHHGLLAVVHIDQLFSLPNDENSDLTSDVIGPAVGAFDLHMFPDWFTPAETHEFSDQLYTAFFADDGKLILEYLEEPCRFLNIEMIDKIEKSLSVNHCNIKSGHFIEMLAKTLVQCKMFVGNLLEMVDYFDAKFGDLSITKVLSSVNPGEKGGVWFASIMAKADCDRDYEKMSPHHFLGDQFMVDRVVFDDRKQCLRVMDHQNIYVDRPDNDHGLYRFDVNHIRGALRGSDEFLTRFLLAGAAAIPDLKYLYNKLIFDF